MVSGSVACWGDPGPGRWITIYANADHVYAEIAGLRRDTVNSPSGSCRAPSGRGIDGRVDAVSHFPEVHQYQSPKSKQ